MLELNITGMSAVPESVFPGRCLWQRHTGAACDNCLQACPTGAIQLENRVVSFDAERCLGCGACLTACPVECFTTDSWSERSLAQAAEKTNRRALEVVCKWHPAPQWMDESAPVVQVGTCLAALSPGFWFELGLTHRLGVHLEYCNECPLAGTMQLTESALERANQLLESCERAPSVIARRSAPETPPSAPRPVVQAERPPMSRRDFMFSFARNSGPPAQALACLPTTIADDAEAARTPPHQPAWLRRLASIYPAQSGSTTVQQDTGNDECHAANWPTLTVNGTCAACGACARYCPSGALATSWANGVFEHRFIAGVCIACGLCAQVCRPGALTRGYVADEAPFQERIVAALPVTACPKCGGPAPQSADGLCFWCANEPPMRQLLDNVRALFPVKS